MKCEKCGGTGKVDDPRIVGRDMRALREKRGKSLRAVAALMDFSPAYLSDLENGRRAWNHNLITSFTIAVK